MYNEPLAKIAAGFIFVGFNVTFLPQFIMGAQGMPRRYYNYIDQLPPFHQTSTIGSYILAVGFLIILAYLAHSLLKEKADPIHGTHVDSNGKVLRPRISTTSRIHRWLFTVLYYHQPMEEFQLGLAVEHGHGEEHASRCDDL